MHLFEINIMMFCIVSLTLTPFRTTFSKFINFLLSLRTVEFLTDNLTVKCVHGSVIPFDTDVLSAWVIRRIWDEGIPNREELPTNDTALWYTCQQ